jgi:predicted short-subunit dehydrogenase-like oxidoreductase (DUF2520 family)
MLPGMAGKPTIAIVGPGRLGTALALALAQAGYSVVEVVSRNSAGSVKRAKTLAKKVGATTSVVPDAHLKAEVLWLCVPDSEISPLAHELAAGKVWRGKIALHSSGALPSSELEALRRRGAAAASAHPMMTFVRGSTPSLEGVPFALEGDAAAVSVARKIARDLGGESFILSKRAKPAYHAWGVFLSPLVVAALVTSEQVARAAGLSTREARKKMLPIVRQTIANYAALGPRGAFSGPLVRGDAEIVSKHLSALQRMPAARAVYLALARAALQHLPVQQRERLEKILAG